MNPPETVVKTVPLGYWGVKSQKGKTYDRSFADAAIEHFETSILQVNFSTESDIRYSVGICTAAEIRGNLIYGTIEFLSDTPTEVLENIDQLSFTLVPRIHKESLDKDVITSEDVDYFAFIYVFMPGAGSKIMLPKKGTIIL